MAPLLLTTLACNAAVQLTSSPTSVSTDPAPLSPSLTTAQANAACSALLPDILRAPMSAGPGDDSSGPWHAGQQVHYLVVYDAYGDQLGDRQNLLLPDQVDDTLDSRAAHEGIWNYFTSLVPAEHRSYITEFSILSDGPNNILAGVSPTYDNPYEWTLKIDVADAVDRYSLTYSLIHEYGHLLTLNASQVPPDEQVFFHPDDKALRDQAEASCPRYFTGEGCSSSGSYMSEFFNRYWSSFYGEWKQAHSTDEQQIQRELLDEFYHVHEEQFLTSYAAASPEEDIAESWAYFILAPRPEPTTIANQKILFFYEYPELVALRQEILGRLCTSFPNP